METSLFFVLGRLARWSITETVHKCYYFQDSLLRHRRFRHSPKSSPARRIFSQPPTFPTVLKVEFAQKKIELGVGKFDRAVSRLRPPKRSLFQTCVFAQNHNPLPSQLRILRRSRGRLQKNKEVPAGRIGLEGSAHQRVKPVETLAHIRNPRGKEHTHRRCLRDYYCRSPPATFSTQSQSDPAGTSNSIPPGNRMVICPAGPIGIVTS